MAVRLDGFLHGTFREKERHGGTVLAGFNEHWSIRLTNVATGRWVLSEFNGQSKDLKIIDEGGGVITLIATVTGIDRLYASDGTRVFQAAGNSRVQVRIDLIDPDNPDDDVVLDEQTVKDAGLRFGAGDCDALRALMG